MSCKLVQDRLAPRLARRFAPTIIQEVKSVYDLIVPIHTGELQPSHIEEPTLYYAVHADKENYYALYAVFHRLDWSELPWPVKSLDEHKFDLEGILRVFDIRTGKHLWCASVFHHQILFQELADPMLPFRIECGGHGILTPEEGRASKGTLNQSNMAMRYPFPDGCGELVSIPENMILWIETYQPMFNATSVKCPWQWGCGRIGDKSKGLIYTDPARLWELARINEKKT